MYQNNRVVWAEGMFLRTQHFQQADRWTERLVQSATRDLRPFPWGLIDFRLNHEALSTGRIELSSVRAILPDGTAIDAPGDADLPDAIDVKPEHNGDIIYLALPSRKAGEKEISNTHNRGNGQGRDLRYTRALYNPQDTNDDSFIAADIEVARPLLKLRRASDPLAGLERVGLVRISEVRSDLAVILDEGYVAPSMNCRVQSPILAYVTELVGLIAHRADAVAQRISDPSVRGTAEIADFLLLECLNRNEPLLRHIESQAGVIHPEEFYRICLTFAGELAIFTRQSRRPSTFPVYRHDDLQQSFSAVFTELRAALSAVLEQSAVAITLEERRHGVRVGVISNKALLKSADFVLAVRADMPVERLQRSLPYQVKIGAVEKISELVNVALPGVEVRPLAVAPRQIPYRQGTLYFQLDTTGQHWKYLENSGAIALHLNGEFPGLEMELWAIKG